MSQIACHLERKPSDKCLQWDFTLGQECGFLLEKNVTESGSKNLTTLVQISASLLPSSGVMAKVTLKLSKLGFLDCKLGV